MRRQRQPLSLGSVVALTVVATGVAAAIYPTKAGDVWHAFNETLKAIAWACVGIFL